MDRKTNVLIVVLFLGLPLLANLVWASLGFWLPMEDIVRRTIVGMIGIGLSTFVASLVTIAALIAPPPRFIGQKCYNALWRCLGVNMSVGILLILSLVIFLPPTNM
jgi:hypothetical protein